LVEKKCQLVDCVVVKNVSLFILVESFLVGLMT